MMTFDLGAAENLWFRKRNHKQRRYLRKIGMKMKQQNILENLL